MNYCDTLWEELNKPKNNPLFRVDAETLISAHSHLVVAKENDIVNALEWISEAIDLLRETPEEDRLASIYDDLDNIRLALIEEIKRIEEGWKDR